MTHSGHAKARSSLLAWSGDFSARIRELLHRRARDWSTPRWVAGPATSPTRSPQPEAAASAAPDLAADAAPPFRFSRVGPKGSELPARSARRARQRDDPVRGAAGGRRAGRLHLPRPVHRPRPDHGRHRRRRSARPSRRPSCSRRARRASTWTRCTAPGRPTRSPRSSTRTTACTSRPATTSGPARTGEKVGHDLPRIGTGGVVQASGRR